MKKSLKKGALALSLLAVSLLTTATIAVGGESSTQTVNMERTVTLGKKKDERRDGKPKNLPAPKKQTAEEFPSSAVFLLGISSPQGGPSCPAPALPAGRWH